MSDGESERPPRTIDFPLIFVGGRLDGLVETECRHHARLFGPQGEYTLQRDLDGFVWALSVNILDPLLARPRLRRILLHALTAWSNGEPFRRYPTRPMRDQDDSERTPLTP